MTTTANEPKAVRFQDTIKPATVETPLDLYFFRPLAHGLVLLALPTPLTANGMTLLSWIVGLAGAAAFLCPHRSVVLAGAAIMLLYGVLDCADGQLARARGTSSRIGRILDGFSDYVVGTASGLAIVWLCWQELGTPGLALGLGGFGSVVLQGTLFDYYKNRYLRLSGSSFREGDDLEETRAELAALSAARGPLWHRYLLWQYASFLVIQRLWSGTGAVRTQPSPEQQAAFARDLAPLARGWAWLGPTTHLLLLGGFVVAGQFPGYGLFRLTLMNVYMLALVLLQRARERRVLQA